MQTERSEDVAWRRGIWWPDATAEDDDVYYYYYYYYYYCYCLCDDDMSSIAPLSYIIGRSMIDGLPTTNSSARRQHASSRDRCAVII